MRNGSQTVRATIKRGFGAAAGGYGGAMKAVNNAAVQTAQEMGFDPEKMVKAFTFDAEKLIAAEVEGSQVVRSKSIPQRLTHLIDESSAFVVLGGGQGTVVEEFVALEAENQAKRIEARHQPRPIIIIDPSLKHTDLLGSQAGKEPKMKSPEVLGNVYVLNNEAEAAELAARIVELYYLQSLGIQVDPDVKSELDRYSFGQFLEHQQKFEGGGGI